MARSPNATGEMTAITCESGTANNPDTITPNRAMESNTPAVTVRPSSRGIHGDLSLPVCRERNAMNPGYSGRTQGEVSGARTPAIKAIPHADTLSTVLAHLLQYSLKVFGGFNSCRKHLRGPVRGDQDDRCRGRGDDPHTEFIDEHLGIIYGG